MLSNRACTAARTCSLTLPKHVPWAFPHSIKKIADSGGSHVAEWQMFKLPLALCPLGWWGCRGLAPNLPFPPPLLVSSPTPCLIGTLGFIFRKYNCMHINVHGEERQNLEILVDAAGVETTSRRWTWSIFAPDDARWWAQGWARCWGLCITVTPSTWGKVPSTQRCKVLLLMPAQGGAEGGTGALGACAHLAGWQGKRNPADVCRKSHSGKGSMDKPLGCHQ